MIDAASTIAGLIVGGGLGTIADDSWAMPSAPALTLRAAPVPVASLRVSIRIAGDRA